MLSMAMEESGSARACVLLVSCELEPMFLACLNPWSAVCLLMHMSREVTAPINCLTIYATQATWSCGPHICQPAEGALFLDLLWCVQVGWTPLMYAVAKSHLECAIRLLDREAAMNHTAQVSCVQPRCA